MKMNFLKTQEKNQSDQKKATLIKNGPKKSKKTFSRHKNS